MKKTTKPHDNVILWGAIAGFVLCAACAAGIIAVAKHIDFKKFHIDTSNLAENSIDRTYSGYFQTISLDLSPETLYQNGKEIS